MSAPKVSVSINLTRKQQGELYMRSLRYEDRIRELQSALRAIVTMAEAAGEFAIKVKAEAALTPPNKRGLADKPATPPESKP